jgi:hypothetical protein
MIYEVATAFMIYLACVGVGAVIIVSGHAIWTKVRTSVSHQRPNQSEDVGFSPMAYDGPVLCSEVGRGFCSASIDGYCIGGFDGQDGQRYCHG